MMKKANPSPPAGYSGTPLPKKLGIKPDSTVALIHAPENFRATLGDLPNGAVLCGEFRKGCDLTLWFVRSRNELREVRRIAGDASNGGIWIVWPKKTSPMASDFSEQDVREAGLAEGLVDYKICAVDADWSGLKFARRKDIESTPQRAQRARR